MSVYTEDEFLKKRNNDRYLRRYQDYDDYLTGILEMPSTSMDYGDYKAASDTLLSRQMNAAKAAPTKSQGTPAAMTPPATVAEALSSASYGDYVAARDDALYRQIQESQASRREKEAGYGDAKGTSAARQKEISTVAQAMAEGRYGDYVAARDDALYWQRQESEALSSASYGDYIDARDDALTRPTQPDPKATSPQTEEAAKTPDPLAEAFSSASYGDYITDRDDALARTQGKLSFNDQITGVYFNVFYEYDPERNLCRLRPKEEAEQVLKSMDFWKDYGETANYQHGIDYVREYFDDLHTFAEEDYQSLTADQREKERQQKITARAAALGKDVGQNPFFQPVPMDEKQREVTDAYLSEAMERGYRPPEAKVETEEAVDMVTLRDWEGVHEMTRDELWDATGLSETDVQWLIDHQYDTKRNSFAEKRAKELLTRMAKHIAAQKPYWVYPSWEVFSPPDSMGRNYGPPKGTGGHLYSQVPDAVRRAAINTARELRFGSDFAAGIIVGDGSNSINQAFGSKFGNEELIREADYIRALANKSRLGRVGQVSGALAAFFALHGLGTVAAGVAGLTGAGASAAAMSFAFGSKTAIDHAGDVATGKLSKTRYAAAIIINAAAGGALGKVGSAVGQRAASPLANYLTEKGLWPGFAKFTANVLTKAPAVAGVLTTASTGTRSVLGEDVTLKTIGDDFVMYFAWGILGEAIEGIKEAGEYQELKAELNKNLKTLYSTDMAYAEEAKRLNDAMAASGNNVEALRKQRVFLEIERYQQLDSGLQSMYDRLHEISQSGSVYAHRAAEGMKVIERLQSEINLRYRTALYGPKTLPQGSAFPLLPQESAFSPSPQGTAPMTYFPSEAINLDNGGEGGIIEDETGDQPITYKGGTDTYHSLNDNAPALKKAYPFNDYNGYFGTVERGNTSVRTIRSDNPLKTAQEFYETASRGGIEGPLENGKGVKTELQDKTVITFRETSKSGTPAVEIRIKTIDIGTGGIKKQKIHFEKR